MGRTGGWCGRWSLTVARVSPRGRRGRDGHGGRLSRLRRGSGGGCGRGSPRLFLGSRGLLDACLLLGGRETLAALPLRSPVVAVRTGVRRSVVFVAFEFLLKMIIINFSIPIEVNELSGLLNELSVRTKGPLKNWKPNFRKVVVQTSMPIEGMSYPVERGYCKLTYFEWFARRVSGVLNESTEVSVCICSEAERFRDI